MPYVIGIILSVGVAWLARFVGFDRDRAFGLLVIASYYVLFAVIGTTERLKPEATITLVEAAGPSS